MNTSPGYNDIVIDAVGSTGFHDNNGGSWTHVVGTGKERILIVSIGSRSYTPTGITYNSIALTKAYNSPNYDSCRGSIWYLMNPPTGSHSVAVTFAASARWIGGSVSAFNVESRPTEIPYYRTAYDTGNASSCSTTINNSIGGCLGVDAMFNTGQDSNFGLGAYQTLIVKGDDTDAGGVSYGSNLPLGNVSFSWNNFETDSTASSQAVVMFLPSIKRSNLLGIFFGLMT